MSDASIYDRVTEKIIALLAQLGEWRKPWLRASGSSDFPRNATTRKLYRGVNVIMLWGGAEEAAYPKADWATSKQFQAASLRAQNSGFRLSESRRSAKAALGRMLVLSPYHWRA